MDIFNYYLLIGSALVTVSVFASVLSNRLGFPVLLVFLGVGMLAGEDGPGQLAFDNFPLAFLLGNLALALILLDGGLRTSIATFRVALRPAAMLATWGVIVSAGLVGLFAAWVLEVDWRYGLLLGAIVGSTDAAAVFALLRDSPIRINQRVRATLEIESGTNDPMAIFLVVAMVGILTHEGGTSWWQAGIDLALQLVVGAIAGVGSGRMLAHALARLKLAEGLYALLIAAGGMLSFSVANYFGGSGFLAIYLCGLVVGNRRLHATEHVKAVMDGMAWLAQATMFLILGLLVTPSRLLDTLGDACLIALFLMLVARPLAVVSSLTPWHFPWREITYISWIGLRGAVPIVLSLYPVVGGIADAREFFDVTFTVVLVSLLLQGTTIVAAARLLRVTIPRRAEPIDRAEVWVGPRVYELTTWLVEPGSQADGWPSATPLRTLGEDPLEVLFLGRDGRVLMPSATRRLAADDQVWMLLPPDAPNLPAEFFAGATLKRAPERHFYGDFTLDAAAPAASLAQIYGLDIAPQEAGGSIGELVERRLGRRPVRGDSVEMGAVTLVVKDIDAARIVSVGLRLTARTGDG